MLASKNTPAQALNKSLAILPIVKDKILKLETELNNFLSHLNHGESEEHNKNLIADLLKNIGFAPEYFVNTKGRNDLVIHTGKDSNSPVGVIIEAKSLVNKAEMPSQEKLNSKALQELVLYFLRERITAKNLNLKHLVITNGLEWFVFDAQVFEKCFGQKKALVKEFEDFENKLLSGKDTSFFYKEIAQKYILESKNELEFTFFNLTEYEADLNRQTNQAPSKKLITLAKYLSPVNLLKLPIANDSNTLNRGFYTELLHIIGLEEVKNGGKKLIQRKSEPGRENGSLLENTIYQIDQQDSLSRLSNLQDYGQTQNEQIFGVALELCITWVNRILFLKLLEAQLISYNESSKIKKGFLNTEYLGDFDELNNLFFGVLAKTTDKRSPENQQKYSFVPYLNSSLFELTELEHSIFSISQLRDGLQIGILPSSVLRDPKGKKRSEKLVCLDYLLQFLDSFAFGSSGGEEVLETEKSLINSAVLGLIFEKINGYKDGSFFTPGFITSYMAKESIQKAVIQKFNQWYKLDIENFEELKNFVGSPYKKEVLKEYNLLVNSLKIVDPAVGSGHFLVSGLNEIIALKSELNILVDSEFSILSSVKVEVLNDELNIFYSQTGEKFEYKPQSNESARIQETIFHEKQNLIEKCLFGVDINPNSVKICRLRLWIELLKNAYYKADKNLQTLPNIDINIKCGNSLISRFDLSTDLKNVIKSKKWTIETYKLAVSSYQNATSKESKREFERLINEIKSDFKTYISEQDPMYMEKAKLESELFVEQMSVFGLSDKEEKTKKEREEKLKAKLKLIDAKIEEVKSSKIYHNAFEWRFEFPEVLGENGEFIGFDVVIGNPPYIRQEEFSSIKPYLQSNYEIYNAVADLLTYFVERANQIMKSGAVFQFIISNKFTRANYGKTMRKYLLDNVQLTHFIDFSGVPVFDEATVDAAILGFTKENNHDQNQFIYSTIQKSDFETKNFRQYLDLNSSKFAQQALNENSWAFENSAVLEIKHKVEAQGVKLKDWDIQISRGILTGLNEAFIVNGVKKDELIARDPKNAEILKPLLRGRDINKYVPNFQDLWLINTHNGYKKETENGLFRIPPININDYPILKEHLDEHYTQLAKRTDKGSTPYNLRNCAYVEDFEKPKIIYPNMTMFLPFAIDLNGSFHNDKSFHLISENIFWLSAFLNSKLFKYCFSDNFPALGEKGREIRKVFFEQIPVKQVSPEIEEKFKTLISQILEMKKSGLGTHDLEVQIDSLVYELYGLGEAEIGLIEGDKD